METMYNVLDFLILYLFFFDRWRKLLETVSTHELSLVQMSIKLCYPTRDRVSRHGVSYRNSTNHVHYIFCCFAQHLASTVVLFFVPISSIDTI